LITSFIIISRILISKIFLILQNKSKINSLIICNSKNLHKIYEYLSLNDKILIKSLVLEDQVKIDFTKYRNFKIKNIESVNKICKKYNIKSIYLDKIYQNVEKKIFKKIEINILRTDDLFSNSEIDNKQQFVDENFKSPNKIKNKRLNYYKDKIILITGAGGSIGKNLFF
jgi:FlaA1/EpsC-like NDP-sugar epimerase